MHCVTVDENISAKSSGEVLLVIRMHGDRAVMRALTQRRELLFVREVRLVSSFSYGDNADAIAGLTERAAGDLRAKDYSVSTVLVYGGAEQLSLAVERQFDLCVRCEELMASVLCELYGDGTALFISPNEGLAFVCIDGRAVTYGRGLPDHPMKLLELIDMQIRYFRTDRLVIGGAIDKADTESIARICANSGVALRHVTEKEVSEHSVRILRALCKSTARERE